MLRIDKWFVVVGIILYNSIIANAADFSSEITAMSEAVAQSEENYTKERLLLEKSYAEQIAAQSELIKEFGEKITEMSKKKEGDTPPQDPAKAANETRETFSFRPEDKVSLTNIKKKKEKQQEAIIDSVISSVSDAGSNMAATEDTKTLQKMNSEASKVPPGKSESMQPAITDTINQADQIRRHLVLEVKALLTETKQLMAESKERIEEINTAIDICNYSDEKGGLLGAVESIKGTVGSVTETVNSATGTVTGAISAGKDIASDTVNTSKSLSDIQAINAM